VLLNRSSIGELKERPSTTFAGTPDRPSLQTAAQERVVYGWRRLINMALAAVFFGLGLLGALLPGIPATPFLLLTSYFLVRSSPRLNARLLRSRLFGPILVDWQTHGGMRMHVRCKAIAAVVIAVAASIYLTGFSLSAALSVVLLATIGILVILRLPAAKDR
jgi:uncharacterized membrane protein YbaN (DUF454 family)